MGKINVLPFSVANLIAAGEVVDRPASVVKELVENSIDAGADDITIEIQNGGVRFIRVTDNGCGIEPDDLPVAVKRHATSKIKDESDLDAIITLGFRGEALAAIASVSHLRIITKTRENGFGRLLESVGGENVQISERGCADGTSVIVEELFANVPARRKFLKKDVTEAMAVAAIVEKIALSKPNIAFKFISDGEIRLRTAGDGNLRSALYAVFGREFARSMLEAENEDAGIRVHGFIGRPENARANRNFQNFFINGRYVKSKTAVAAVEQAYLSYMQPEKFPVCVLFVDINPAAVDVNVHPSKLEVKFSNEKPVFEAVYYAVRSALVTNETRPDLAMPGNDVRPVKNLTSAFVPIEERSERIRQKDSQIDIGAVESRNETGAPAKNAYSVPETSARVASVQTPAEPETDAAPKTPEYNLAPAENISEPRSANAREKVPETAPDESAAEEGETDNGAAISAQTRENVASADTDGKKTDVPYFIIGEAFNSYVFVQRGDVILVIDKHAAHERIIFERLKKNLHSRGIPAQMLLVPIPVSLTQSELGSLCSYRAEMERLGFAFDVAPDGHAVAVSQMPTGLEPGAAADFIVTVADRIGEGTGEAGLSRDALFEKALYQGSCKAAIKAGREYPPEYVKWVVDELMRLPDITYCPHGRPVAFEMRKSSIDRQFERI